ncbi:DoxX-like family protein [Longirhabdus pacifica]|uniref:DoxX-like family protein n=1 Tax=Longirhabdus pacifica TaxID=2305227 RepID=UPI001008ACE7|nr:DoxX-like family protein [Longirhabdus pacifica]
MINKSNAGIALNTWIAYFFSFVWIYHGLVPKLLTMQEEEITMITDVIPLSYDVGYWIVVVTGVLEILFGLLWLFYSRKSILYVLQIIAFAGLMIGAVIGNLSYFVQPFNPFNYNLSLIVLSFVGYALYKEKR